MLTFKCMPMAVHENPIQKSNLTEWDFFLSSFTFHLFYIDRKYIFVAIFSIIFFFFCQKKLT